MDGRMPDNEQIDEALKYAINHSPVSLEKLSPDGKLLVEDVRDILESARMMIAEKNSGELFQNFVWSTSNGDITRGAKSKDEILPVSKGDATADAKQGAAHLRTLLTLFLTNSEARKLLNDIGLVARDLFATGAAKVAEKARPDQQQLDQVDKPAPSGEWVGADGKRVGRDETPELEISGPGKSGFRMNPKDDPANASVVDPTGNTRSAGETYDKAQEARQKKNDLKQEAIGTAKSHAQDVANSNDPRGTLQNKAQYAQNQAGSAANQAQGEYDQADKQGLKSRALNSIPDEHREKISDGLQQTREFLDDNFPEERRNQFIYRLKKVVVECQEHKDYQDAMSFFLDKAEEYKGHAAHVASHGADSTEKVAQDSQYQDATRQFRTLLERFANGVSMQPMIDSVDQLYKDADNDQELRQWWSHVNNFIHKALLEPGWILDDDCNREADQLQQQGRKFFEHKYKGHFDNFGNQVQRFFVSMGEDPLNVRFGEDWKRLVKDLLFNAEGNLEFKPKLWNDIRRVVLPTLIQQIGYVPIPRAEYSDKNIDLVIENLVLQGSNIFPNIIDLHSEHSFKFSPYDNLGDQQHHVFSIGFSQIQADLRDVQFAFRRKTGWPKIRDSGLADCFIGGTGITVHVTLESVENRRDQVFRVKDIKTDIDTLKFSIRDSKHDLLYKFIKATATGIIKKAIQAAMHEALRNAFEYVDEQLVEVRNRMEDAKKSDETTRAQALKDLFARKKEHAQHTARKVDEKTGTFKIVTDRNDSVVQDLDERQSKESWSKRQFKVEDAAKTGKDWRSPVFSLFSKKHPASSGEHHPNVSGKGVSSGHSNVAGTGVAGSHATGSNLTGNNVAGTRATGDKVTGTHGPGYNSTGNNVTGTHGAGSGLNGSNVIGTHSTGHNVAGAHATGSGLAGNNVAPNTTGSHLTGNNLTENWATGPDPRTGANAGNVAGAQSQNVAAGPGASSAHHSAAAELNLGPVVSDPRV